MLVGLVKPLVEDGDNGTPLTAESEGDLERRSDCRRSCGVVPVYSSLVLMGDPGWGKAAERVGGASPTDGFLCKYAIIIYHRFLEFSVTDRGGNRCRREGG